MSEDLALLTAVGPERAECVGNEKKAPSSQTGLHLRAADGSQREGRTNWSALPRPAPRSPIPEAGFRGPQKHHAGPHEPAAGGGDAVCPSDGGQREDGAAGKSQIQVSLPLDLGSDAMRESRVRQDGGGETSRQAGPLCALLHEGESSSVSAGLFCCWSLGLRWRASWFRWLHLPIRPYLGGWTRGSPLGPYYFSPFFLWPSPYCPVSRAGET